MKKIAVIIMDANTLQLTLAKVNNAKNFMIYNKFEEDIELSQDLERENLIKPNHINKTLKILKMFKKICEAENLNGVYAYAAEEFGVTKNYKSFFDELNSATNIQFKIYTKDECIDAVYQCALNTIDLSRGIAINIDSTETRILKYNRRTILSKIIIPYGPENLVKLFMENAEDSTKCCNEITEFISGYLTNCNELYEPEDDFCFVGMGQTFTTLTKLSKKLNKYSIDMEHGYTFDYDNFNNAYEIISGLALDNTKKIKGIGDERADIFAAGLAIIKAVFQTNPEKLLINCKCTKTDSFLYKITTTISDEKPSADLLSTSLKFLCDCYGADPENSERVSELSGVIFRQLKVLHKLSRTYSRALKIASYLHESGCVISYLNRYKCAQSIILNSNIFGASHKEILLASFIVNCVEPQNFSLAEWVKYKDTFDDEDLVAVKRLAAILKIAIGLDITHNGNCADIICDVLGDSVIMKTVSETDIAFEIKSALKSAIDFKKAFNKYLEIL